MKPSDDEVYRLGCKFAHGKITKTQFNYWLSQWEMTGEELIEIIEKKGREQTVKTFKTCLIVFVVTFIFSSLLIRFFIP